MEPPGKPLVGVVGPCGSGKSTLIAGLEQYGYRCRHMAQEHSHVQAMWALISRPDLLIYLDASYPTSTTRRQLDWQEKDHQEQLRRLSHARQAVSVGQTVSVTVVSLDGEARRLEEQTAIMVCVGAADESQF